MSPELGLIEGFFGRPWGWEERAAAVRTLAPHGYRFFLYAPKADGLLRRHWEQAHPDAELEAIAGFSALCREDGVRFGIGLTPFELHLHEGDEWQRPLAAKLASLADAGLDDLAILFDDMRGDDPAIAERQARIVSFAAGQGVATRILCCPSYYSDDPVLDRAFGQRPANYLKTLGSLLDPAIEIMWTGEEVCSREFSPGHFDDVAEKIGRKPFLWDNYPVNDGTRMSQHLHLRAFTGRPAVIGSHIAGHGINVASQPTLSHIPALTLARSYAEGHRYRYGAAFAEAAVEILGDALAQRVQADLLTLQDRGLDRIAEERKAELRAIYERFDHPAAREIVAWLGGAFNISDELVQTQ